MPSKKSKKPSSPPFTPTEHSDWRTCTCDRCKQRRLVVEKYETPGCTCADRSWYGKGHDTQCPLSAPAIIIAPVTKGRHGRTEYAGTEYESLDAARVFTKNAGRLARAILLYNGIQYGTAPEDFAQAAEDATKPSITLENE